MNTEAHTFASQLTAADPCKDTWATGGGRPAEGAAEDPGVQGPDPTSSSHSGGWPMPSVFGVGLRSIDSEGGQEWNPLTGRCKDVTSDKTLVKSRQQGAKSCMCDLLANHIVH